MVDSAVQSILLCGFDQLPGRFEASTSLDVLFSPARLAADCNRVTLMRVPNQDGFAGVL